MVSGMVWRVAEREDEGRAAAAVTVKNEMGEKGINNGFVLFLDLAMQFVLRPEMRKRVIRGGWPAEWRGWWRRNWGWRAHGEF